MFKEMEKNILKNPQREIIYFLGNKITNQELYMYIGGFAQRLKDLGVKSGDVVTIALPNIPQGIIAFYAVNKIGGICNMVHPKSPVKKTLAMMKESSSKVAILIDEFYLQDKAEYDSAENLYIFSDISSFLPKIAKTFYRLKANVKKCDLKGELFFGENPKLSPAKVETHNFEKNAPAIYLHSSGTIGMPKTVMLSCVNMNFVAINGIDLLPNGDTSTRGMLAVLPMFHGFGLCMTIHTPIIHNMQTVLIPDFSPKAVVSAMKKTTVSVMCGVPKMYEKLARYDGFADKDILKNVEVAFCGGEAVPDELYEKFNLIMKNAGSKCMLFEGYGLTETVTVCTVNTAKENKKGSCGKAIPGARLKIVDESGNEVPRGTLGKITISAPSVMVGYLQGGDIVSRGYLETGDVGWVDADNFLYFKQREKHVINVAGFNVYPTEIVEIAKKFPGVVHCVVLKGQDEKGEFAKLVVQMSKNADMTDFEKTMRAYLAVYLESWCVPKQIVLFDGEMPLNMVGKVDLRKVEEILNEK
ncbi:MAG: class I adenylate-forming enzyme family protein [Bacillota bacterium]